MRVLHMIAAMDPALGGVSQAVRTIIACLAARGTINEVVSLDTPNALWSKTDPFITYILGPSYGPWSYSPKLMPWLLDNLVCFDAVILHGLWLYPGYAMHKALRRLKYQSPKEDFKQKSLPKLFVMPHGMLDPYFQQATDRKLKALRNWAYWQLIEGSIINEAEALLFTCETERLLAHKPFAPYHPKHEIVVGLGVEEPPPYVPIMRKAFLDKCPELRNRPYLLFLSRIHEKKGVELLIKAYLQIARNLLSVLPTSLSESSSTKQLQSLPLLVIAGPGLDTSYGQRMQQLAAELSETSAIFFPGMLTGDAKWGAFYGCEAFILPSHQENFGIAVVEALACSKPVLISDQVNIWREISASGGGMIEKDDLGGTERLVNNWCKLSYLEKRTMETQALISYKKYFSVGQAAERMAGALD